MLIGLDLITTEARRHQEYSENLYFSEKNFVTWCLGGFIKTHRSRGIYKKTLRKKKAPYYLRGFFITLYPS